ncbi:hypothetical protein N7497_009619 [Penicillium chrysogenum]|nr:hypothetical protein N7497_009619 [Penicillium chrysogenum]
MATREAGGYSRRIEPTESNVTVWEGRGTSLSVTARKAAERVVAQLDGDGGKSLVAGGCRRRKPYQLNVSVCEHAEGSRACGDLLPPIQILLQAAWLNRKVFLLREGAGDVSVCERAEGSGACGGSIGVVTGWMVGIVTTNQTDRTERLCL